MPTRGQCAADGSTSPAATWAAGRCGPACPTTRTAGHEHRQSDDDPGPGGRRPGDDRVGLHRIDLAVVAEAADGLGATFTVRLPARD